MWEWDLRDSYAPAETFSQSASNFALPSAVSGCLTHFLSAAKGTVAMSAPMRAAWVTWLGVRTEAVIYPGPPSASQ